MTNWYNYLVFWVWVLALNPKSFQKELKCCALLIGNFGNFCTIICEKQSSPVMFKGNICTILWGWEECRWMWEDGYPNRTSMSAWGLVCCMHILAALHDGSFADVPYVTQMHRSCFEWWISQGSTVCQRVNYTGMIITEAVVSPTELNFFFFFFLQSMILSHFKNDAMDF